MENKYFYMDKAKNFWNKQSNKYDNIEIKKCLNYDLCDLMIGFDFYGELKDLNKEIN